MALLDEHGQPVQADEGPVSQPDGDGGEQMAPEQEPGPEPGDPLPEGEQKPTEDPNVEETVVITRMRGGKTLVQGSDPSPGKTLQLIDEGKNVLLLQMAISASVGTIVKMIQGGGPPKGVQKANFNEVARFGKRRR